MFPKAARQAPLAPAALSGWSQSSPLSLPGTHVQDMLTSQNLPCPCTPRFPFQHFTSGTFHTLFQLMAEHPATRAPHHALSLPSVPRPTPWSLYAELSRHLMSPQTRLTWRLLGPPPWCTSPPRSGPGPASWGLCCTRGGCGPEGRKR